MFIWDWDELLIEILNENLVYCVIKFPIMCIFPMNIFPIVYIYFSNKELNPYFIKPNTWRNLYLI